MKKYITTINEIFFRYKYNKNYAKLLVILTYGVFLLFFLRIIFVKYYTHISYNT